MTTASPSLRRDGATPTAGHRFLDRVEPVLPLAAAVAAGVLAWSSTGSMVVAAVLLGAAVGDRRAAAAPLLAVAATAVRFATAGFDDLAGIQSVLGNAVVVGPATAAASAWCAAAAVVLVVGRHPQRARVALDTATALAAGGFAAALAAGQGPGGELWQRLAAGLGAVALAGLLLRTEGRAGARLTDARRWLAVGLGAAAVVLAAWP